MSEHRIALEWNKGDGAFSYETYNRNHSLTFKDGQETLTASASPAYRGDGSKADPEDMLVAALSSCHMLSFLAIAAKKRLTVLSYQDDAVGFLEKDGPKLWISRVILRPKVEMNADHETLMHIHHMAHDACFIANSVKTDVTVEPR
jgi:organic hydroperoxide reductase OsmC/OhrA